MKCPKCNSERIRILDIIGNRLGCIECRHQFYEREKIDEGKSLREYETAESVSELRKEAANSGVTTERENNNFSRKNLRKMRKGR